MLNIEPTKFCISTALMILKTKLSVIDELPEDSISLRLKYHKEFTDSVETIVCKQKTGKDE